MKQAQCVEKKKQRRSTVKNLNPTFGGLFKLGGNEKFFFWKRDKKGQMEGQLSCFLFKFYGK